MVRNALHDCLLSNTAFIHPFDLFESVAVHPARGREEE